MDFTISTYVRLLKTLSDSGYCFKTFADSLTDPTENTVVLRHDVDRKPLNSFVFAQIQAEMGIRSTYFFRIVEESFDPGIIRKIADLGHEIGYHYEDFVLASKKVKGKSKKNGNDAEREIASIAIESFEKNLSILRELAPVKTICMHGSPLSRWDSKLLWKYYDYHDFGLKGEPYFDVDFSKVLYLTDTGRMWDGSSVSIRDKATQRFPHSETDIKFHSTFDIIRAAEAKQLPGRIMFTFHPQRWNEKRIPWLKELCAQNMKNIIKHFIIIFKGD